MTIWIEHWDDIYSTRPMDGLSWYQERADVSLELVAASGVARDGRIMDVGAGASRLADGLLADGYTSLVLVDISAAALDLTRSRLPESSGVELVVGDINRVDVGPVALWHDRATYHFLLEPNDQARYAAALIRHVMPGGHCIIATFAEDGPEICSGYPTRRYAADELASHFSPVFSLQAARREVHHTPDGREQPFNYVLMSRTRQPNPPNVKHREG